MKKNILKFFTLAALVVVPLSISLSSCSSGDSDAYCLDDSDVYCSDDSDEEQDNVMVTTLAGSTQGYADGVGSAAQFWDPRGIAVDASGNLYVTDTFNHRIRKINPAGEVTTFAGSTAGFADGTGIAARFSYPAGIAIDALGNLYVMDYGNNNIRKVTPEGVVTTLAGNGLEQWGYADSMGNAAKFNRPYGITIDTSDNLYVADTYNNRIRKISPAGEVTTLAGSTQGYANGTGSAAQFNQPYGIAIDKSGNLYVLDTYNNCIRKITPAGVVTTFAGSNTSGHADGKGSKARFSLPNGITIDTSGNLYVADTSNNNIRKVTPAGEVTTLAGKYNSRGYADGKGSKARFNMPNGIAIDASGNLYIGDTGNNRIRKMVFK